MKVLEKILQEIEQRINEMVSEAGECEEMGEHTEAEVIDHTISGLNIASNIIRSHMEDARKDLQTAISAIEELQRYKEIGTVEQVKNQKHNLVVAYNMLGKYQQIGTLEECREAREKQQAIPAVQMSLLDFPEAIP